MDREIRADFTNGASWPRGQLIPPGISVKPGGRRVAFPRRKYAPDWRWLSVPALLRFSGHPTTVVMSLTRWAMSGYLDLNDGAVPSIVERDKVLSGASTRACGKCTAVPVRAKWLKAMSLTRR